MLEKIELLKGKIGKPYQMFDVDKNYCGCFYPIYEIYPHLPHFPLPNADPADNWDYGMEKILENAYEINEEYLLPGDVIVTKFNNELHVALYIGDNRIIHVFRNHTLQISRVKLFKNLPVKYFRIK